MKRLTYFAMAMALVHCFTLFAFDGLAASFTILWPAQIDKNKFPPPKSDKYTTCLCAGYRVTDSYTTSLPLNTSATLPEEKSLHLSNDFIVESNELIDKKNDIPKTKPTSPRIDTRSPKRLSKISFWSAVADEILPEEIRPCPEGESTDAESDSDGDEELSN